ncbi:MAG: acyltransferase [Anaerovoracaceae bacterium]|jgi:UDP-2-acetamido-3-amino-2,3-dideoxy-glucuronate N-acetyltransferase
MAEYFVHVASYVDDNVYIGKNTEIWHFSHIQEGAYIGENCSIGHSVNIGRNVHIGHDCTIQSNVSVYEGITLKDDVYLGSSMVFTNNVVPRANVDKGHATYKRTTVYSGATIGANSTVVCGNDIGTYAMVAAGAVVLKDVPAHALVAGVPARQIGWVCDCGHILPADLRCPDCGKQYQLVDGELVKAQD